MAKTNRIFLIGPQGGGKSTGGKNQARHRGLGFGDTGPVIEERGGGG